jgi:hypothetical protein
LSDEISIYVMRFPTNEVAAFVFSKTFGKILSDTTLSLDGSLSSSSKGSPFLLWQQIFGDDLLGTNQNSSYPTIDVTSIQDPFIVFTIQAMIPKQNFVFRLTATSPRGYFAFADIAFSTNEPPSGGTFDVMPKVGTSLKTMFVLSMPLYVI